jgi:hypothetical protein
MIHTTLSILFLEAQFREIENLLKYSKSITYQDRMNRILERLEFQYMRSMFIDHKNTVRIMSRL